MATTKDEIEGYLSGKGVFTGMPVRRAELASLLVAYGIDMPTLRAVWLGCKGKIGLFVSKLQDPASAVAMADDVERLRVADSAANSNGGRCGMQWVSEDNPYGWEKVDSMKDMDHDEPGLWNVYRQDYNLAAPDPQHGDHRVRTCTRIEVAGVTTKNWKDLLRVKKV